MRCTLGAEELIELGRPVPVMVSGRRPFLAGRVHGAAGHGTFFSGRDSGLGQAGPGGSSFWGGLAVVAAVAAVTGILMGRSES
jgi:hypothetical protein